MIYPGWLRYSVTFLVPVAFAVTVPAGALTSRLEWETLALAAALAVALFTFSPRFLRVGLRRYSGASARAPPGRRGRIPRGVTQARFRAPPRIS